MAESSGSEVEFNNVDKNKDLMESLQPLRDVEDSLSRTLEEVRNTELKVESQGDSVANTIETSFEELHTILETRKQQLLEEAKGNVRKKIENLKGQEKNLSIASAGVRSVIDYTEQCVRHCSDEEVMSMRTEMSRRIQEKVEEHSKVGNRLEPVEEADMGVEVSCVEDLQQLCLKTKITHAVDYLQVKDIPSEAEINKQMNIEILSNYNDAVGVNVRIECIVKCLSTGTTAAPKVEAKNSGNYEISYTPVLHGRHELSITANGQPIPGSPFTMTVYMSPTELSRPFKVWDSITQPNSIAVNSVGEVIVAEFNEDIVVFNKDGKRLRSIERSKHQMYYLQSVAVDTEDNIYFVGRVNKLGKSNRSCNKLLVCEVKQKGPGYIDIAVVGDEVMVTEQCNNGQIKVYDKDLEYIRDINTPTKTKLKCLCPDRLGNLYITDNSLSIQVLSKKGDFLRSFGKDQNGVLQLKDPWMVLVSGQYVYVADCVHRKIVVFTAEGNYVASFGSYGGICVSKDGVLYVGDYLRNNVACYSLI